MKYIRLELYKLHHSRAGQLFMLIPVLAGFCFIIMFLQKRELIKGTFQLMVAVINNLNNNVVFTITAAFVTSFLFAKEFQDRSYLYVFFRPISLLKLYFYRVIAIMLYLLEIILIISIICVAIGIVLFHDITIDTGDISLVNYIIRNVLFIILIWLQNFFASSRRHP